MPRYDPTKDDHAQFEQKPKKDDSPELAARESQQPLPEVMPSVPEVTQEKYYDVKTDALTAMFGEKKEVIESIFEFYIKRLSIHLFQSMLSVKAYAIHLKGSMVRDY